MSAKKIVGLPLWSKNPISLQLASVDPIDVFIQHRSLSSRNVGVLRRMKSKSIGLPINKAFPDARQVEINYARWTSGFLYTNQIKNKFDKYPRLDGSQCRFGCQDEETREHVLLECVHLDTARQKLLEGVQGVKGVSPSNLQDVLGLHLTSQARKCKIAKILYEFLCESNLHM